MGDYVLESNPALERLIERLGAPEEPEPLEESLEPIGDETSAFRRRRSRFHADHRRAQRRAPAEVDSAGVLTEPVTHGDSAAIVDEATPVEDELWAIHEDLQRPDELLLVDFDEEPEIFDDDDAAYRGEYEDEDGAEEPDEILDLYGEEDEEDEEEGDGVFDAEDVLLAEDEGNDVDEIDEFDEFDDAEETVEAVPVAVIETAAPSDEHRGDDARVDEDRGPVDEPLGELDRDRREKVDWIIRAFDAWKSGVAADDGDRDEVLDDVESESDVESEAEVDADADTEDPAMVPGNNIEAVSETIIHEEFELLEPSGAVPAPLVVQLSVPAGRKKARHKRQSPRQRKRSVRKAELAEQKARKAQRASK